MDHEHLCRLSFDCLFSTVNIKVYILDELYFYHITNTQQQTKPMFVLYCCIIPCHMVRQQLAWIHTLPPDGSVQRISIRQAALEDVSFHALPPGFTESASTSASRKHHLHVLMDAVRGSSDMAMPLESSGLQCRGDSSSPDLAQWIPRSRYHEANLNAQQN